MFSGAIHDPTYPITKGILAMTHATGTGINIMQSTAQQFSVAVFDGDGIGPEIMAPTVALLAQAAAQVGIELEFEHLAAGAAHYRDHGSALPEQSLVAARAADAILLSAMGLPSVRYSDGTEISPQIDLRMKLGLFAGVRPVFVQPGQDVPLKSSRVGEIDFVLIRESTEGLFHSHGKGQVIDNREARETLVITRDISEKLFHFAFRLARQRRAAGVGKGLVHCIDKANVFKAFAFFRQIFFEVAAQYPDITAECAYVDATALWMVQKPWMFDVLVTENMFGDILSDLGAGLMGSLGLAPSADIGAKHALFQPCHGSAPDIAGKGIANPMAMILSGAMMLDWLGEERHAPALKPVAAALRGAVSDVMVEGATLPGDLGGRASTLEVARAVGTAFNARMR
jgi:3-isopropylmalate dehydrogenase